MAYESSVHAKAIELIKLSIEMTAAAGSGHPTSAASIAHIVTELMYEHMRYAPSDPDNLWGDRLVLSEGHACPIVYAAGADLGIAIGKDPAHRRPMTREDALSLRKIDSEIDGHPNPAEGFPFFPAATGSLGQGLSIAAGLALAARLDGSPGRIFCIIGDGESREGQIWEAVDFIVDQAVTAVCPIFNCNGLGQAESVSSQQSPEHTVAKLTAAGFEARLIDGHDPRQIREALEHHAGVAEGSASRPFAIVARTVKGWGFPNGQGNGHHGKPLEGSDMEKAFAELDATAKNLRATFTPGDLEIPPLPKPGSEHEKRAQNVPSFREALKLFGQEKLIAKGKLATRKAYGVALHALGYARPDVVALDGDVRNSTYSEYFFDDSDLKARFFECRIAEQHMISCAVGLSAGGKVPFASTFGKFVVRAYDQVEMGIVSRANLKIAGSHTGVTLAADGPSQMALPDVAFFHSFATARNEKGEPVLYVLNPCDAYAAYALTIAMAEHDGPCYMRTLRPETPFLYGEDTPFELGGHRVVERGSNLLIVASGYMVHEAKKAMDLMRGQGIEATLADFYSLPFDVDALIELVRGNQSRVLTLEDNYGGGLGSAVAAAVAGKGVEVMLRQMHVRRIPKSGRTPDDVLAYLGLSKEDIARAASEMVAFS